MAADDIAREEVEEEERTSKKRAKKDKKSKKKREEEHEHERPVDPEGLKELEDMIDAVAESEADARASSSKAKATPGAVHHDDYVSTDGEGSLLESDSHLDEWLEWEEFVSHQGGPGDASSNGTTKVYEALVYTQEGTSFVASAERVTKMKVEAPSVPCMASERYHEHRERVSKVQLPFPAAVSRPVSRKEMLENPEALKKMRDEWNGLTEQGTFEFGTYKDPLIYEYDDIRALAKEDDEEIRFGSVHGITVEKHWQLPTEDPRRKFKGRAVVLGNKVKLQIKTLKLRSSKTRATHRQRSRLLDGLTYMVFYPRIRSCWLTPFVRTSRPISRAHHFSWSFHPNLAPHGQPIQIQKTCRQVAQGSIWSPGLRDDVGATLRQSS